MHTHIHTVIVPSSLSTLRITTINTQYSPTVEVVVDDGLGLRGSTREVGSTGEGGSTGKRESHAA